MSMDYSDRDIEVIVGCVQGMVDVINKSLQLTQTSKVIKTKVSRLNLAKQRLGELKALVNEHSFIWPPCARSQLGSPLPQHAALSLQLGFSSQRKSPNL
jgi:hypothetical protein